MNEQTSVIINQEIESLEKTGYLLQLSFTKCLSIGTKDNLSPDEMEKFEAFCSRFARTSDMLIQVIYRLMDEIDMEESVSERDSLAMAASKGIIQDPDKIFLTREIRNKIALTYEPEKLKGIFSNALNNAVFLLNGVSEVKSYYLKNH